MTKKIHHHHDKFVRASFSDPNRAASFFEKFLPLPLVNEVDLTTLQSLHESYIQGELAEHFSDMVFEVKSKVNHEVKTDIVLLFEHKSSPDRNILIQVGHYMFSHWFKCLDEKKELKIIIPLIYYQGKKKWTIPELVHLFPSSSDYINSFVPALRHIFIALNSIPDDKIAGIRDGMMAAAVMAQKKGFDMMKLAEELIKIFELFPEKDSEGNFMQMIIVYVLSVSDVKDEELAKTLTFIPPKIKENIMTTYSRLIEKGEQIGIQKGKTEVVLSLNKDGIPISQIIKYTNLSEEEVLIILKKHGITK
ncbi:MAG: Rpn family recombination-promoting nuclease/putative transposase [Saprospiraceae bacterium]|nr:Rpn family recombination-promoting nuclease/putative transposase [Saprospiraceae bacterium]